MLLTIDAGNTNCVFALYDGERFVASYRCKTDAQRTSDEYASWVMQLLNAQGLSLGLVNAAIISSVVPDANFQLMRFCESYCKVTPVIVGQEGFRPEMPILLDKPEEIGADRLVNASAAIAHYGSPVLIIDFGTATTFDVITPKGEYNGGVIAPGINLSLNALHAAAAKLPKIDIQAPATVTGKNTIHAMRSGIYWGYVSLIEGLVKRLVAEMDQKPTIIATGGLAPTFADALPMIDHVDGELIMKGLVVLYNQWRDEGRLAAA
ncbi:MAG: type III pantothenate kinase [Pseudobdellovibrionaceae bacterium]